MPNRPRDANQLAKMIVDLTTGDELEPERNAKQKAGRLGGLKGGKARADSLTKQERSDIAKKPHKPVGIKNYLANLC